MQATTTNACLICALMVTVMLPMPAMGDEPRKMYEPTWESLDRHQTPKWLMDAKLGVFIYPLHPTAEDWHRHRRRVGLPEEPYPFDRYAWPKGARDKATWDPEALAQLAVDMGAKYVVYSVDPISHFLTYPSKYADIEGSEFSTLGPKGKDYVGELAQAVRARGLRYGLYRNYLHPGQNPYFLPTMYEMIDRYQPDTLWLDEHAHVYSADELRSRELAAYYYNHSQKQDEVALEDSLGHYKHKLDTFGKRLMHGDWFRKEVAPPPQDISDGYYVRYEDFFIADHRTPGSRISGIVDNYIHWLIHCASHNGNLEIAIWASPQSALDLQKPLLRQIGDWLRVNGEAIYGTRPWFDGRPSTQAGNIDVRFTTKGESLYAILLDWPKGALADKSFVIPHLKCADDTTVELIGRMAPDAKLPWKQTDAGLEIEVPLHWRDAPRPDWPAMAIDIPCDHAYSFKITPRPTWED